MTVLHPLFIQRIQEQFPEEADAMIAAMDQPPKISVHAKGEALSAFRSSQVAHYAQGYFLETRPVFTTDPRFHLGKYYPQESSSMVIGSVVRQISDKVPVKWVLDLCAAPGGKTILLHENLSKDGVIYANEIHPKRNQVLQENLMKWGVTNSVILQSDVAQIKGDERWDLILLDAPCSGEGLFRKDPASRSEWTPEQVIKCAGIQKSLVEEAFRLLAPNGILIYSTCTHAEMENQDIVSYCIDELGMEGWGHLEMPETASPLDINGVAAWQFLPHRALGEGFFCCVLKKPDAASSGRIKLANDAFWQPLHKRDWPSVMPFVKDNHLERYWLNGKGEVFYSVISPDYILPVAKMVQIGAQMGTLNKQIFTPHQGMILSENTNQDIPRMAVSDEDALKVLRGEDWRKDDVNRSGWHIVQWQGMDLAWVKMVKGRVSNHYPKEWRIRYL
ncbi:MAG: hypothetical protein RLY35_1693 [Bacteroidota bacterium]|jgi:16S rRNA C967 or C1407 C5-methylase (RsmB/RsmF family)/NOL1/NOP2/fmu family ribosome biogenesis protein